MKKVLLGICPFILLVAIAFSLVGCSNAKCVTIDGDYVVITADLEKVSEGATLKEYMDYLKEEGQMDFVMDNGMITSIDGKTGTTNQYWMLYTDDTENSNAEWGTCEYNQKIYNSASLGAEQIVVKEGCTYIWYLQSF